MSLIKLPYHKTHLDLPLEPGPKVHVLTPENHEYTPEGTQEEIVRRALAHPIASPPLSELVKGKKNIVIISSDHTRPVPSHINIPLMLEEIKKGNADADVTILVATGMHRPTTDEELVAKFGQKVVDEVAIVNHFSEKDEDMIFLGILPSGGELWVNKLAVEADLLLADGFIEPHFFAGFSGGRKSVLPGVASRKTVMYNHNATFISSPYARTGNLENNPIHRDMLFAAEKAKLAFILNVVINANKEIIYAVAGDSVEAHLKGCAFVRELVAAKPIPGDIVISTNGGYPLDQNLYQAVKGMTAAEASAKPDAVIIMVAACSDGLGGEAFYRQLAEFPSAQAAMDTFLATAKEDTPADQWESQILCRMLIKHKVIMVSDPKLAAPFRDMHLDYAETVEAALAMAKAIKGDDAAITVIPDGVGVIVG
ncbi:nickel-dependent lactate racemase [Heliobacterium gestii]|uniref:Nickel-dependent lactate racemase n=1 Tax=Heliomicrobium gestii TaxID=2699 RepID=A0A845LGP5_HELGE|nr:nickel-dependent lactate racemase [Heliomicrobium gestii]MBM7866025.1 nickel-dependent lactate racemase [Heliomicrobium gestii]MZP42643.1 nickel-dependent lactate racemase [Heliomicrobium gestii]